MFRAASEAGWVSRLWSCCRSSVVEHPLGKGEVGSSILLGSTISLHIYLSVGLADM